MATRQARRGADASARWRRSTCSPTSAAPAASGRTPSTRSRRARSATRRTPRSSWRARARCLGLPIRVLSREQEARYGYLAAVNSTTLRDGCVLDLGGGSLQLVRVARPPARELGLVAARHGAHERALPAAERAGQAQAARGAARARRGASSRRRRGWPSDARLQHGRRLVGIGGTVRNLAAAAQRAAGLPSNGVQGMVVEREALDELVERLAALPAAERASVPGIKPARADLILAGAVVVQGVLQAGGFDALETTEAGLREGVFFERLLDPEGREGEPPLFADVRARERAEHGGAVPRRRRPHRARRGARAGHVRRARAARAARGRRARARAAVGGLHAARHRHVDRLRRPPQALALPDPQRRPARASRRWRPRSSRRRRATTARACPRPGRWRRCSARATPSAWTAARRCCAWPRISSARATSSCATRASRCSGGEVELRLIADGESAVPALGGRPRARAVRARLPPRSVGGGLTAQRRLAGEPRARAPAQSNSTRP